MKKFNMPPGDYGAYCYSGVHGSRARRRAGQVHRRRRGRRTRSARTRPTTTSRASSGGGPATTSPSRTCGSSRAAAEQGQGRLGPARHRGQGRRPTRSYDRTCAEKGLRLACVPEHLARRARRPGLHRPRAGDDLRAAGHRPVADLRADDGGELRPRRALHAGRVLRRVRCSTYTKSFWVALIVAPLMVGALGLLIERFLIRRLYGRAPTTRCCSPSGCRWSSSRAPSSSGARSGSRSIRPRALAGAVDLGFMDFPGLPALRHRASPWRCWSASGSSSSAPMSGSSSARARATP